MHPMNMNIPSNSKDSKQPFSTTQEYQAKRFYSSKKAEPNTDKFSDISSRLDSFSTSSEANGTQGALYSVSQQLPVVTSSCTSLRNGDATYNHEMKCHQSSPKEWEKEEMRKDVEENNESAKDNHGIGSNASSSIANLPVSCGSVTTKTSKSDSNDTLQGPIITMCVYLHNKTAIMMDIDDTPTAPVDLITQAIINCEELSFNKHIAVQVFTLWMVSPLLELQLKRNQRPYEIRKSWRSLIEHYSHASYTRQERDEPKVILQRNVFYPLSMEEKIKDPKTLELLYEEAKDNIINGRYPCEVAHYIMLGGVQAHIELGPYNPQVHSTHYFREEQHKFLPMHVRKSATWTWLPISYKNSPEVRLLEHYKRVPASATNRKLMKKYLEFCWTLPFYGSAFFEGQVEQPVLGLTSLITYHDIPVLVAINATSVYVIDDIECTVLLGLRYEDLSWEYARPSKEDDPNCLPCLFLQFMIIENGARVSKILQIFSRQAPLMDSLINQFVNRIKQKTSDETDNKSSSEYRSNSENDVNTSTYLTSMSTTPTIASLANKLGRLNLATFDENGHCIGRMGSWDYNY